MEYLTGALLLLAFLVVVAAIVRGQSPIIMLLLLAIVWAVLAGIGVKDIQAKVLQGGGVQYASAVIIIVFGAWFAQVLIQTGIAESVIRSAVELTGDRPDGHRDDHHSGDRAAVHLDVRRGRGDRDRRHRAADHDEPGHSGSRCGARLHHGYRRGLLRQPRAVRHSSRSCFRASSTKRPGSTYWIIGMVRLHRVRLADDLDQPAQAGHAPAAASMRYRGGQRRASARPTTPTSCRSSRCS